MTDAFVALGGNVGDRLETIAAALRALDDPPRTAVDAVSLVYESEPWGLTGQPQFANAVARLGTRLTPEQMLGSLLDTEVSLGRVRGERYGPRVIDLDLLLYGGEEIDTPDLVLPHPRLLERDFVVTPLLDVAPEVRLPDATRPGREAAVEGRVVAVLGPVPGFEDRTPALVREMRGPEAAPGEAWEVLEQALQGGTLGASGAFALVVQAGLLRAAGIPALLDPPPLFASPGVAAYGITQPVRLMVPASRTNAARLVLERAAREA